jgi:hypothetical protein
VQATVNDFCVVVEGPGPDGKLEPIQELSFQLADLGSRFAKYFSEGNHHRVVRRPLAGVAQLLGNTVKRRTSLTKFQGLAAFVVLRRMFDGDPWLPCHLLYLDGISMQLS